MKQARAAARLDEGEIDAIFRSIDQCHLPGAVVGIALRGRPVYRKGFGLASLDAPLVLTPSTRLRIGSVTKQFTCLAYLLLCEEGRANVDDPVGKFLPELHPANGEATMRQLMAHTSGVRDAYTIFFQFNDARQHFAGPSHHIDSAGLLEMYRHIDDRESPAGTAWMYSNGAYLLLSAAIERITGEPLEATMAERIFMPLGMNDTLLMRSDTRFIPNRGSHHVVHPEGGFERMHWGVDNFLGAGAMLSTVDDLLRWLAHMDSPRVGSRATWDAMTSSEQLANGVATWCGLGLLLEPHRGVPTIAHSGGAFGGGAHVLKVPSAALDIVVLSNRQDAYAPALAVRIMEACLPDLAGAPATVPVSSAATGTFRSTSGTVVQLAGGGGKQTVAIDGGVDLPFEAGPDGVLRYPGGSGISRYVVTLVGSRLEPDAIRLDNLGVVEELVRAPPAGRWEGDEIVGRYHAEGVRTDATIEPGPDGLVIRMAGPLGSVAYGLQPLSSGLWRASRLGVTRGVGIPSAVLAFEPERGGFRYSGGPLRLLRFDRCK